MVTACFYLPDIGIAVELVRVPYHRDSPLVLALQGVISTVSDIAKRQGISAGMTITGARALCRDLIILPYDRASYAEAAEAVWDILATESSKVEPVSPEICFLELSEAHCLTISKRLGALLVKHVKVSVMVGIGSSKLVAEQAARKNDKSSLVRVQVGTEAAFLASIPLISLRSVHPAIKQRLMRLGVNTLGDILRLPERSLTRQFKEAARHLQRLAVGEDGEAVRALWPPPVIEEEIVFEEETIRREEILLGIKKCAAAISAALEEANTYCRKLMLLVSLADGSEIRQSESLRAATNEPSELSAAGQRLLRRLLIDRPIVGIKVVGGGLGAGSGVQLSLLDDNERSAAEEGARSVKLEETIAYVRQRFGVSAVVSASLFKTMRQSQLWVYPLGQRKRESVMVATDRKGRPLRFYRSRNLTHTKHEIAEIQDQWNQAAWSWEKVLETECFRVVTDPWGLHQLEHLGVEWTLTGTAD